CGCGRRTRAAYPRYLDRREPYRHRRGRNTLTGAGHTCTGAGQDNHEFGESNMAEEFVSLKQLAADLGMDRSHARRYVLRLGFPPHKRRTPDSQNQLTLAVTIPEAEVIRNKRREAGFFQSTKPVVSEVGVFYVIRLVPELDPRRLKLGFADDLL